jgi:ABC-type branched-subunit amino acid transport system substrate-binding protein
LIAALVIGLGVACEDDDDSDEPEDGDTPAAEESPSGDGEGDATGVTDTSVKLGTHTSLTGPIAAYNVIPRYTAFYFDYINDTENGVNGRTIEYVQKDDQYNPSMAVDLTRQLVEQDGVFAVFNALGTPNHLQVVDYLQENGVPDMYLATGATEWVNDPSARPMVFGSNPNYTGEGLALGVYIAENFAGQNIGVIYQNDDFGIDGLAGVQLGVGDALEFVGEEPYEVANPNLNASVDRLRSADADVVVFFATPAVLGAAIKHARADLGWDAQFFISAVSMNELTAIIAGPENMEGTMGPVATYMAYQTDHTGVQEHADIVAQSDVGSPTVLTLYAQYVAEMMVETLRGAAEPLTRESLVASAEALADWTCSVCLFPVTLGPDDHDPSQAVALGIYRADGTVGITDIAYSWEGVPVADLSPESIQRIEVPAAAVTDAQP